MSMSTKIDRPGEEKLPGCEQSWVGSATGDAELCPYPTESYSLTSLGIETSPAGAELPEAHRRADDPRHGDGERHRVKWASDLWSPILGW